MSENTDQFNGHLSGESTLDSAETAPNRPNREPEQREVMLTPSGSAEAFLGQDELGEHVAQEEEPAPKKKTGAPFGNMNNFQHGGTWLRQAREGQRKTPESKRLARRFEKALVAQLGGEKNLSAAKLEIIGRCRRIQERLLDMYAARDKVLEANPNARTNIGVLARLETYLGPIEDRLDNRLARLGLERESIELELAPWEQQQVADSSKESK